MRVGIAGGRGKIALLLERLLAERGDQAVGLVRNPAHVAGVRRAGAEAVVCDLEAAPAGEVAVLLSGADAVVFAAGAGAGSGAARTDTAGRGGSVLMAGAAGRAGVRGFVRVSSMGAGQPPRPGSDETARSPRPGTAFPDHGAGTAQPRIARARAPSRCMAGARRPSSACGVGDLLRVLGGSI